MITTIRRGEVYQFATMDPAVLDEVRDIEWSVHQAEEEQAQELQAQESAQSGGDGGLVAALRRLFGRSAAH
jgi:hypothetical protein